MNGHTSKIIYYFHLSIGLFIFSLLLISLLFFQEGQEGPDSIILLFIIGCITFFIMILPHAIFYCFIVAIPLFTHLRVMIPGNIPLYIPDVLLLLAFLKLLTMKPMSYIPRTRKLILIPAIILFLGVFSFLNSLRLGNPFFESLYAFGRMALSFSPFFWAYTITLKNSRDTEYVLMYFLVSCVVMTIMGTGILYNWNPILTIANQLAPYFPPLQTQLMLIKAGYYRLSWGLGSATATGGVLAISVSLSILFHSKRIISTKGLLLLKGCIFINTVGLLLTWTRHGWLSFLIALGVLYFVDYHIPKRFVTHKRTTVILAIIFLVGMSYVGKVINELVLSSSAMSRTITSRLGLEEQIDFSGTERIVGFIRSLEVMGENLLTSFLGAGPGHTLITRHGDVELSGTELFAHNSFSAFILNWGGIALILFMMLFFHVLYRNYLIIVQHHPLNTTDLTLSRVTVTVLIIILVILPIDHYFITVPAMSSLLWLFLGIGYALIMKTNLLVMNSSDVNLQDIG